MRVFNFLYENDDKLKATLEQFSAESNILIQIFDGSQNEKFSNKLIRFINAILPHSEVLLCSSAAEISDGRFHQQSVVISVSIFQKTTIKTLRFKTTDTKKIVADIATHLITKDTKSIIMLGNVLKYNATDLLNEIALIAPNIALVGGYAGDDFSFSKIFIGDKFGTQDLTIVCAALDSKDLKVYTDCIFEWIGIGVEMTITGIDKGGIIKTINNIPARELYRKYLGDIVADNLPNSGFEIPLVYNDNGLPIGRSSIAVFEDGSIQYAGEIPLGTKVRFGICSLGHTKESLDSTINKLSGIDIDAIFIYSCVARYMYFKSSTLDYAVSNFNNTAPTSGFFTFGEFFHTNNKNYLLNASNTFIALSEGLEEQKQRTIRHVNSYIDAHVTHMDFLVHSLCNLVSNANNDYTQMTKIFKQYKDLLEESSILSYINLKGEIINVNDLFLEISKYSKDEVIGKKFSFIIAENADSIASQIWQDIQNNNIHKSIIKGIAADSSIFYVRTIIKPIKDVNNNIMMFICTMDDMTALEAANQNLQHSIEAITEISIEKEKTIQEYQSLLDRSTAMVRVRQEVFVEVNKSCEELFAYPSGGLIGKHILSVTDVSKVNSHFIDNMRQTLATKGYLKTYIPCIDSNGNKVHVQAYFMAINVSLVKKHDEEIIGILHNVTELFDMQEELEDVQKEVIYAMGSISEGRSRETGNHVKRVAEYSYLIAKLYGLSEEDAILLKTASPMHDIGKLAIPDAILNKPGKLTPEEFEIMKTHTTKGYEMLCFSNRPILQASAQIALTHHEWWNGEGYPNQLKGEEIPLFGRITAVADVFDALSNDRCYKKAWPIPEVIEYMIEKQGVQFQAEFIDLLVENLDEFVKIKDELSDKFDS